ncbi:MAG: diaminopimelate epimerase [Burkholderiaceae bacterium]|nr:diaminopimelate epimerase [Burkholderiaceae bacterium]
MKLKFTKMHGAGNDFVVIDAIGQSIALTPEQSRFLADRRFGVGADQILVVEQPTTAGTDFRYRIFNNDGSEVEQCGNGARAFVKFVTEKGLTGKRRIRVETKAGIIELQLEDDGNITVDMGAPVLEPSKVPFDTSGLRGKPEGQDTLWPLYLEPSGREGKTTQISVVSMGNPHAVQVVPDIDTAPVTIDGPLIEQHRRFPARVNAGFMRIIDRHTIRLRVYERGAGETLACGTGACAAVVAGIRRGLLESPVRVEARGGVLNILWGGEGQPVMMSGPAVSVFDGEIELPA